MFTVTWCSRSKELYNWAASGFEVKHMRIWKALWGWCCSRCMLHWLHPFMQSNLVIALGDKALDMHSAWGCASQTPRVCSEMLTPARVGTHLSKLWPYTGIGPKVGGGYSLEGGALLRDYSLANLFSILWAKLELGSSPHFMGYGDKNRVAFVVSALALLAA